MPLLSQLHHPGKILPVEHNHESDQDRDSGDRDDVVFVHLKFQRFHVHLFKGDPEGKTNRNQ